MDQGPDNFRDRRHGPHAPRARDRLGHAPWPPASRTPLAQVPGGVPGGVPGTAGRDGQPARFAANTAAWVRLVSPSLASIDDT